MLDFPCSGQRSDGGRGVPGEVFSCGRCRLLWIPVCWQLSCLFAARLRGTNVAGNIFTSFTALNSSLAGALARVQTHISVQTKSLTPFYTTGRRFFYLFSSLLHVDEDEC